MFSKISCLQIIIALNAGSTWYNSKQLQRKTMSVPFYFKDNKESTKGWTSPRYKSGKWNRAEKTKTITLAGTVIKLLIHYCCIVGPWFGVGWGLLGKQDTLKKYLLNEWYYGARGLPTQKNWGNGWSTKWKSRIQD